MFEMKNLENKLSTSPSCLSPGLLSQHLKLSSLQEELHYGDMFSQFSSFPEVRSQAKDRAPADGTIIAF